MRAVACAAGLLCAAAGLAAAAGCRFDGSGVDERDGGGDDVELDAGTELDAGAGGGARVWLLAQSSPRLRGGRLAPGSGAWADEGLSADVDATPSFVVAAPSPDGAGEVICVLSRSGADWTLTVLVRSGAAVTEAWKEPFSAQMLGTVRPVDVAWDERGAMVVYATGQTTPRFRRYQGGVWSDAVELPFASFNTSAIRWVELEPDATGARLAAAWSDDFDRLSAAIWDGDAWAMAEGRVLTSSLKQNGQTFYEENRCFDLAFEQATGELLVAWGRQEDVGVGYATWSASSGWSAAGDLDAVVPDGQVHGLELTPQPGSARIAGAFFDQGDGIERLGVGVWDGGAWRDSLELDVQIRDWEDQAHGRALGAVEWLPGSDEAVLVYGDELAGVLDSAVWSDTRGWTLRADVDVAGKGLPESFALVAVPADGRVVVIASDDQKDLYTLGFDGTEWSGLSPQPLYDDLATEIGWPVAAYALP